MAILTLQKIRIMKKSIGIDISKEKFDVCMKVMDRQSGAVTTKGTRTFANTQAGFDSFIEWIIKKEATDALMVVEATGVYHENLTCFLYDKRLNICVELPNKIKNYARCLNVKTKNDRKDAAIIAQYALERKPRLWEPMTPQMLEMRSVSREIQALKHMLVQLKNQMHALSASGFIAGDTLKQHTLVLNTVSTSISQLENSLEQLAAKDRDFIERARKVATIKGVQLLTVLHVLCETNGFFLSGNLRQAVSYAGLDVSEYSSGTIRGKSSISKRGNSHIRQLLYMPAMVAANRTDTPIADLANRVKKRNPHSKKIGIIAAERKLLILIYTLWKKNEEYDIEKHRRSCRVEVKE